MAGTEDTDALALAYVEGEMDASAARAFEARLAGDPALRAEVDGLRAIKELLGADARFGQDSKIDVPPAHLVDAIMNAEAIARPAEIRQAAALQKNPPPTFTAKLARWLLGGGALVAGATVIVFGLQNRAMSPEQVIAPTVAVDAPAPAPVESAPKLEADKSARAFDLAKKADAPADMLEDVVTGTASADGQDRARADAEGSIGAPPRDGAFGDAAGAGLAQSTAQNGAPPPPPEPSARLQAPLQAPLQEGAERSADAKQEREERQAEKPADKSPSPRADDDGFGFESAKESRSRGALDESKPAAVTSALTTDEERAPDASEKKRAVSAPKPAAQPTPDPAPTAPSTQSAGPGALGGASADTPPKPSSPAAARKELYDRRVAEKLARRAKGEPAKDQAPAKAKASKSSMGAELESPDALRAAQEADLAFTTGLRELQARRYPEALTAFQNAERFDRKHALGVSPIVGQMRCHAASGRLADAARLSGRLLSANVKAADVVDGLVLGADAAEKTGDTFLAEQLYTRLLEVPAHKANAERALARLRRPMRNKALEAVDADAASEAPAAAAPAESR